MKNILLFISFCLFAVTGNAQNVPIDFESGGNGAGWTWTVFENNTNPALVIGANPDNTGINTSATSAEFTALQSGQPWAGTESQHTVDLGSYVLDATNSTITIMVYKPVISNVGIKLVTPTNGALPELLVPNTVINQWEELTFDFSSYIGQAVYATQDVDQIVIFPDFDTNGRTQDNICYFDNINFGAGGGTGGGDLTIITEVCSPANEVRLTGPFWGWDPLGGPIAIDNGNGTWTFTFSPAPSSDMEYLLVVDSVQENLIAEMQNGGTCAPITDFANYANRIWYTTDPDTVMNTYNTCGSCVTSDLTIITEVCTPATEVRLTGPLWGWDPNAGPFAVDNGNGTWTFTFSPAPSADMEYLLIMDGVQENLISEMQNGGTCAPVTDFANYANRQWLTTDPDTIMNIYQYCDACPVACDAPVAGFTETSTFLVVDFTDASTSTTGGVTSWAWDFGDGNTSTMQNPTHTYAAAGTYTVCLIATDSCDADTICNAVSVIVDGIEAYEMTGSIQMVPNPTNGFVSMVMTNIPDGSFEVALFDVTGKMVENKAVRSEQGRVNLDFTAYKSGVYLVRLQSDQGTYNVRLIKE